MNPGRYFMPNMGAWPSLRMVPPNLSMNTGGFVAKNSLFSRLASGIKGFNWSGLLNGASKTLNVFNQTIPLIRQTKPMVNNVRNMISVAKAFRKETNSNVKNTNYLKNDTVIVKKEATDDYPSFFI